MRWLLLHAGVYLATYAGVLHSMGDDVDSEVRLVASSLVAFVAMFVSVAVERRFSP
jgi:hypothetical protein